MSALPVPDDSVEPSDGARAGSPRIRQLRLVIEVDDWESAIRFYRDALGLDGIHGYAADEAAQLVLEVGRGTIELVHPHLPTVDGEARPEVTSELNDASAPRMRLAFESDNSVRTMEALVHAGATQLTAAKVVPNDTLSGRLEGPDGMPITVFQSLSGPDFSEPPPHAV